MNRLQSSSKMAEPTHPDPYTATDNGYPMSMKDVIMWRKKRLSFGVVITATALWMVMEVYGFNFITVASWIAIFVVSSLFAWTNFFKLIYKEEPTMSGLGISENTATRIANLIREFAEEGTRWMFKVGAQSEWYVFAATIAGLWLLSVIGSTSDLLTLLYIGIVMGMTVPVISVKYDNKIREYGERLQMQSIKFYSTIEKIMETLKTTVKVNSPKMENKEKKVE